LEVPPPKNAEEDSKNASEKLTKDTNVADIFQEPSVTCGALFQERKHVIIVEGRELEEEEAKGGHINEHQNSLFGFSTFGPPTFRDWNFRYILGRKKLQIHLGRLIVASSSSKQ